jgi:Tol biopolymer transport system component
MTCTVLDQSKGYPDEDDHHKFFIERRSLVERDKKDKIGALGLSYDSAGSPVYSPDGSQLAFKVLVGAKMGVAVDMEKDAPCTFEFVDELTFDPHGNEVAFVASSGCKLDQRLGWQVLEDLVEAKGGSWFVVVGSTPSSEFERTQRPTWSPDGSRLAFAARQGGAWRVVVGTQSSETCDEVAHIGWAPDGQAVWYGARRGQELWWSKLAVE